MTILIVIHDKIIQVGRSNAGNDDTVNFSVYQIKRIGVHQHGRTYRGIQRIITRRNLHEFGESIVGFMIQKMPVFRSEDNIPI